MRTIDDMSPRTRTAIIAPNALALAGLCSLLEKYAYRIVSAAETADKWMQTLPQEMPELVLIMTASSAEVAAQASACRRQWPDCRIVTIYDYRDPTDHERIRASSANGCVATSASEKALLRVLDFLVQEEANDLFFLLQVRRGTRQSRGSPDSSQSRSEPLRDGGDHETSRTSAPSIHPPHQRNGEMVISGEDLPIVPAQRGKARTGPKLSERELQILDGIVRGQQNKMIARTCGITEATVKVHMKSILRKIQVANRTQAAIWAIGNNVTVRETLETRVFETRQDENQH